MKNNPSDDFNIILHKLVEGKFAPKEKEKWLEIIMKNNKLKEEYVKSKEMHIILDSISKELSLSDNIIQQSKNDLLDKLKVVKDENERYPKIIKDTEFYYLCISSNSIKFNQDNFKELTRLITAEFIKDYLPKKIDDFNSSFELLFQVAESSLETKEGHIEAFGFGGTQYKDKLLTIISTIINIISNITNNNKFKINDLLEDERTLKDELTNNIILYFQRLLK